MPSLLVVEDSKFMAKAMCGLLVEMTHDVVGIGYDGNEGLALFQEKNPDVVLMDITMPNMDGIECLTEIKKLDPAAKVIMISAIKDQATVDRCLEQGAFQFLQKPFRKDNPADIMRLSTAIEKALRSDRVVTEQSNKLDRAEVAQ